MSLPHDSAENHVTGKSEYVDDRPMMRNELFCEVILSTRPHALIKKIDFSKALKEVGVVAGFTGKDFPHNVWGTIFKDQPILAQDKCQYAGEAIGLLVGSDLESLQYAKQLVEVEYEDLKPILSIDQAKKEKSFIGEPRFIKKGDAIKAIAQAPHKITGQIIIQGADHFYLENQASVAYPLEDGQIEIHSSSQHPTETQHVVAHSLGLSDKDVVCVVKRLGGGFGGKESQAAPIAAMAALGAYKLKRPVRISLTKDDDMVMTGKRNPFQNDYEVGFDDQGRILGIHVKLFSDAGAYADLSTAIMERAMLHSDNVYYLEHALIEGQVCKTNHHPHTAFRGFGGPKGVATIERIIEEIAHYLNKDPIEIRKINIYNETRNTTHYGQVLKNNCIPELFDKLEKSSRYFERRKEIDLFNKNNDQFVKGLSMTGLKFGISFTTRFLNQANALVIIHQDGTLQVSTGATEMGQGVNARISELVSSELGLNRSDIRMMPTRTDKNANTSPTAASSGTDLNGSAALLATRKIKFRLSELALKLMDIPKEKWARNTAGLGAQPEILLEHKNLDSNDPNEGADWISGKATYFDIIFEKGFVFHKDHMDKKISFKELVVEAYLNRINLSDYAHYRIPGIEFNKLSGQGNAFLYFTQGTALSEVILNKDTGELKVESVEILMDLGRPINEALDRGQVAGAFIQGMGWVTTENLFYNKEGLLLSHAPSTYKIPSVQDFPRNFKIELIQNKENYANVRGTKAVGEPPLLLSISVWTAVQNALSYLSHYKRSYPRLKLPATNEAILRKIQPDEFNHWSS